MEEDNISLDLELEKIAKEDNDFVPNEFEWLTLEEMKLKAEKLEKLGK